MRKTIGLLLALILLLGCIPVLAEDAAWVGSHCEEDGFSTRIPAGATVTYETTMGFYGMRIYFDSPGLPCIIIHRRPLEGKFKNPVNYLNNTYREFLEDKFEDTGTNPAKTWEVGGKKLIGARYLYNDRIQVQLIEVRDLGDVEYTALFTSKDQDRALRALDIAVENYLEDELAAGTAADGKDAGTAGGRKLLEPMVPAEGRADLENGTFWADLTQLKSIDAGGYFNAALYLEECYAAAEVEALKPGDRVKTEGAEYTVKSISRDPSRDDLYLLETAEDSSRFQFVRISAPSPDAGNYHLMKNGDVTVYYCTDYRVMLPLPYAFQFAWVDGQDVQLRDADDFLRLLREEILTEEDMTHDLTALQFRDGLVTAIVHAEY